MLETIITSLVLMSVSGIAFIAYKHPDYFIKMYTYLISISIFIYAGITIWNVALSISVQNLHEIIQKDKIDTAAIIINGLKINPLLSGIIFFGVLFYLIILLIVSNGLKNR